MPAAKGPNRKKVKVVQAKMISAHSEEYFLEKLNCALADGWKLEGSMIYNNSFLQLVSKVATVYKD